MRKKTIGVMNNTCTAEVNIPPTIGTAIGFMTSDPTPELHWMGSRLATVAATVMSFDRNRSTAPATVASWRASSDSTGFRREAAIECLL